jgi:hypothetical protein
MLGSNSNFSMIDGQQATTTTVATTAAKGNVDDTASAAQAAAATTCREQEALITAMAATHKTLDEAWAHEHAASLTWEKQTTTTHHLEQQLATAHGIMIP